MGLSEQAAAAIWSRSEALHSRFRASCDATAAWMEEIMCWLLDCARLHAALAGEATKAMEAIVEAERVRGEQLAAYGHLLDKGNDTGAPLATALLAAVCPGHTAFPYITAIPTAVFRAVGEPLRIRDGVDPLRCRVSGPGLAAFVCGDSAGALANNTLRVCALDASGTVVESLEDRDVCVYIKGATVACVTVVKPGIAGASFLVPLGRISSLPLSISLLGSPLSHAPAALQVLHAGVCRRAVVLHECLYFLCFSVFE